MSGPIERPEFYEGQVLAAADLGDGLAYSRNQLARHERYLHEWGIAVGLTLVPPDKNNGTLGITAGVAIDGTGREIVVDSAANVETPFSPSSSDPNAWFPVFLVGKDAEVAAASTLTGACDAAQPSRIAEKWDIEFGNPGDELGQRDLQPPADPTTPPDGDASDQNPWKILVGFVQVDSSNKINAAADSSPNSSVKRKYAGVQADDVRARGDLLTLETSGGALGKPQLSLDGTGKGLLDFRLAGQKSLFNVDDQGNLSIAGKITSGQPPPGAVFVESGVVSDGMVLPLPKGVSASASQVTVHVHLTLHPPAAFVPTVSPPLTAGSTIAVPLDCSFDPTTLVVSCLVRWIDLSKSPPAIKDLAGSCDYVVAVTM